MADADIETPSSATIGPPSPPFTVPYYKAMSPPMCRVPRRQVPSAARPAHGFDLPLQRHEYIRHSSTKPSSLGRGSRMILSPPLPLWPYMSQTTHQGSPAPNGLRRSRRHPRLLIHPSFQRTCSCARLPPALLLLGIAERDKSSSTCPTQAFTNNPSVPDTTTTPIAAMFRTPRSFSTSARVHPSFLPHLRNSRRRPFRWAISGVALTVAAYASKRWLDSSSERHAEHAERAEREAADLQRRNDALLDVYGDRSSLEALEQAVQFYEKKQ
ncbi:hypothetical protein HIM_07276 [Hirsutella minnesotensis 3608]|uniref:Uncharacterized protein n=1 Tax=Hirsutella minnesotensis 3608 TaxID=1043627 RepID=A0A0F7ZYY3_9HYPO|nr:hypothetical protein HIM_07276 [Hirsutella minnesotensis 3608]